MPLELRLLVGFVVFQSLAAACFIGCFVMQEMRHRETMRRIDGLNTRVLQPRGPSGPTVTLKNCTFRDPDLIAPTPETP